ncbi:ectoine hydrolase DoeA [Acidihalobacter ferrooxydans]|uniref:Ectoine hydrolase DoeA n=1 Tax=Acidihalobacter ferrooxydans TaxID=1765967 RepID=A0A1P8UL75_9GAMM|nr:ectoine hydrolase DoeA [Acidihalobacter ferrooxydans]
MPFSPQEYAERVSRTKALMKAQGLEVFLVFDPANMNYLTGYDGWSFYVPQLVVIALAEPEPIWIGRGIDANGALETTYLDSDNIYSYSDRYVQHDHRHPMDFVAHILRERELDNARIGLDMDSYYFSARGYEVLRRQLSHASFTDVTRLVSGLRSIKSPQELEYMRQAGQIMQRVMKVAVGHVEPGVRQCDAVGEIYRAQMRGTRECGGDYPAIVPMLPTGRGTSTAHLTWNDKPFVQGEATILELAAARYHYHCPMARTVFLGTPPQRLSSAAEIVAEGVQAALEAVRPGATCESIEAAWRAATAPKGLVKESRIGYSMGLNYPPDWGEHTMSLRPGDRSVLEPGMTFHLIPGIWMDDWGVEISESFVVTETGHELLAPFPRKLFVKP